MSPPRQGRYKLAGERTPRAAENHAATVSALLSRAHALTPHEQRQQTLTHTTTITNVHQASGHRAPIHTPNTRQRLLSTTRLKTDTRIRANKTNRRDNTHLIPLIHRRRTTNQRNLRPRALTAAHRPHVRIRPTQVTNTTQQGTNFATATQTQHRAARQNRINLTHALTHTTPPTRTHSTRPPARLSANTATPLPSAGAVGEPPHPHCYPTSRRQAGGPRARHESHNEQRPCRQPRTTGHA